MATDAEAMTRAASQVGLRLLADYVDDFNDGARRADFSAMVARFAPDASLTFEGIPVGPFQGREAIVRAYAEQPPDDTLTVLDARFGAGRIVAGYAWDRQPGFRADELQLEHDGMVVRSLTVTFATPGDQEA